MFNLPLKIKATERTPLLEYNPKDKTFNVIGVSIPDDAKMFYGPILLWVDSYTKTANQQGITINVDLDYFSIQSSLILLRILKKFESLPETTINWYFDDNDTEEIANDFSTMINIKFNLINKNTENNKEI